MGGLYKTNIQSNAAVLINIYNNTRGSVYMHVRDQHDLWHANLHVLRAPSVGDRET